MTYGLEFMGKEWDSFPLRLRQHESDPHGRRTGDGRPTNGVGFANGIKQVTAGPPAQAWHERWAREAFRVLRPGGHLLAFGGTRTSHRLACAIEDAGFEIRDSIVWMHAQGFPKSLDIGKQLDKMAGAEREVVGVNPNARQAVTSYKNDGRRTVNPLDDAAITAPATDLARQWDGWGTALKPAHEYICLARKPLTTMAQNVLEVVELNLRNRGVTGEIRWTKQPVERAAKQNQEANLCQSPDTQMDLGSAACASGDRMPPIEIGTENDFAWRGVNGDTNTQNNLSSTATAPHENLETKSLMRTGESVRVAERLSETSSPLTISMAEEINTESPSTARSTQNSGAKDSPPDTECFAGIATGLTGSMAHVLIKRLPNGAFVWPNGLPTSVPPRPLSVAQNVMRWGTGGLNIDGSRIAAPEGLTSGGDSIGRQFAQGASGFRERSRANGHNAGRWPANVLLSHVPPDENGNGGCTPVGVRRVKGDKHFPAKRPSGGIGNDGHVGQTGLIETRERSETVEAWECEPGCPVALLDEQAGERKSGGLHRVRNGLGYGSGTQGSEAVYVGTNDGPNASRFFFVSKASRRERNAGLPPGTVNGHPTVKPIQLMRHLVRLVTPPGGTVLDCFMGSGSTGCACVQEGFDFVGIDAEEEYVAIAGARIAYWASEPQKLPRRPAVRKSPPPAEPRPGRDTQLALEIPD